MKVLLWLPLAAVLGLAEVRSYEGTLTVPTYEPVGREMEAPLFANSSVTGLYPFPTYRMPFEEGGPRPKTYRAIFVENEYLKLTYLPELGGRIFSLYDKIRGREVFYRNDVIKPAPYNPRLSWPQSGLELTGPYDVHMLTLHGEPYWWNRVVKESDGAVTLVLGETDPVYRMDVRLSATLHPGVGAMEIRVYCHNPREARMPQMLWINTAVPATPKTRFFYPMTRTVGHTTADIADWPVFQGTDYSWDRNNQHMLGVFGIDLYDNFQGAYQFENDYGVFRWADRRQVQGMKMWTFGYGPGAKDHERGYTDKAGPYVELQSGRHVWDGHYEWVAPHKTESWSEWWMPVAGTGGLTTLTKDVGLELAVEGGAAKVTLSATRVVKGARVAVRVGEREVGAETVDLDPAKVVRKAFGIGEGAKGVRVVVREQGKILLDYARPDEPRRRGEYTPLTRPLEEGKKAAGEMTVEELTNAAEYRFKEMDEKGGRALAEQALGRDGGYSRAHVQVGIQDYLAGRAGDAVARMEKAIGRDPYASEAYYYLALAQLKLGKEREGERNLYFVWPDSAYYGPREYQLGRLRLLEGKAEEAVGYLRRAATVNGMDLRARWALAVASRELGRRSEARAVLEELDGADPSSRMAEAERFLWGDASGRAELIRLLGGQSQESLVVSAFYRDLGRWKDAVAVLRLTEEENHDPWGIPSEFYYTLAYCQRRAGDAEGAKASLGKARGAGGIVDRFPYREESEAVFGEALGLDSGDVVARQGLARLLYRLGRQKEAIGQWERAVESAPESFSLRRELGLAYAEQGYAVEKAAGQLERAVALRPAHVRTLNDLSALYARAGRFEKQAALLKKALERTPGDDGLAESLLTAHLIRGDYEAAEGLIAGHRFAVRHRSYGLRDQYRWLRYGQGWQAMKKKDFAGALERFEAARKPPVSLGVDDFAGQDSPRLDYYVGLALERLGRKEEARKAFERAVGGMGQLTGDRDSWNSENFYILPALDHMGRQEEAARLARRFENFAMTERDARDAGYRAEARYLLGLLRKREGKGEEAERLWKEAMVAKPEVVGARMAGRGELE